MGKKVSVLAGLFSLAGIATYLFAQYEQGQIQSFSDAWDSVQSLAVRGFLYMRSLIPNSDARTIAAGFIAAEESFSPHAYPDPPGQASTYSIGYGHQIRPGDGFNTNSVIDEPTGFGLLLQDMSAAADCVDSHVFVQLTKNELAALYSFCYNVGCSAFASSTLLRDVNAGDLVSADAEFDRWIYANGKVLPALQARRDDEQALFEKDGLPS